MVFVSGWGLSCEMWQYQMASLVDRGLRTIAYDRRGHGRRTALGAATTTTPCPMTSPVSWSISISKTSPS